MQDFYILQRTSHHLTADALKKWYHTVELLAPSGVIAGDDDTSELILSMQDKDYLYIIPLVRHLTEHEAEKIVNGYMRVTTHDFEIETSNVYRADADFSHPFEYDINIDEDARETIHHAMERQNHNAWIHDQMDKGWRFGINLDIAGKTHPAMRPWDDLPEEFKRYRHAHDKELLDYYSKNLHKFKS
tara:strand:- start:283 stop:843 length:561 start_codon:yes stop_codon:yes gene_type:complete